MGENGRGNGRYARGSGRRAKDARAGTAGDGSKPDDESTPTWRERFAALRYVGPLISMVWQTHRGLATAMVVLRLVRAFVPVATLWVGKLIIDRVVALRASGGDWSDVIGLVGLELAIVTAGDLLGRGSAIVESLLGDLFSNRTSVRLMEHAATLDLAQFEDPEFYDHLERARRQTTARLGLMTQLVGIGQDAITIGTLGAALVAFNPWLVVLLVVAILPGVLGETHFAALGYSLLFRRTPERRQLDYLRFIGASDRTAKEVQLFGLAPWITERYRRVADAFYEENKRLAVRRGAWGWILSVVGSLGYYGAFVLIIARAVTGAISLGTLTFLTGTFASGRGIISRLLGAGSGILEQSLYLRDLFIFFEMKPTIASPADARPVPRPIRDGFVFEDVGFQYPGSERWAVRHVSLRLRAGERLALVGENGAGKTTLTKLIARLYDPTEGRILLDGRDLREYDLAELRRAIGVIFQDFVRYDMAFDENIGVGEIWASGRYLDEARERERQESAARPDDADAVPDSIRGAADRSLAAALLPRLPRRYGQMLGRRFDEGVDLSGGEWQKVALARAYMRDAQLMILDEPTAALDARAEYEVFRRFTELMTGRMALIISHRFSTVRMADRIAVLDGGRVVEEGSHEELVARGGMYADLFALQAAGYR